MLLRLKAVFINVESYGAIAVSVAVALSKRFVGGNGHSAQVRSEIGVHVGGESALGNFLKEGSVAASKSVCNYACGLKLHIYRLRRRNNDVFWLKRSFHTSLL